MTRNTPRFCGVCGVIALLAACGGPAMGQPPTAPASGPEIIASPPAVEQLPAPPAETPASPAFTPETVALPQPQALGGTSAAPDAGDQPVPRHYPGPIYPALAAPYPYGIYAPYYPAAPMVIYAGPTAPGPGWPGWRIDRRPVYRGVWPPVVVVPAPSYAYRGLTPYVIAPARPAAVAMPAEMIPAPPGTANRGQSF